MAIKVFFCGLFCAVIIDDVCGVDGIATNEGVDGVVRLDDCSTTVGDAAEGTLSTIVDVDGVVDCTITGAGGDAGKATTIGAAEGVVSASTSSVLIFFVGVSPEMIKYMYMKQERLC